MNQTALVPRPPTLVKIGDRSVSIKGFRVVGAIEHLMEHLVSDEKWCRVGCLATTMLGRNSEANRSKIRRSARLIFRNLLEQGTFLVISYDPLNHGRISSMKIFQGGDEETQHALLQLERMHKRKQLTDELFQSAKALVSRSDQ